MTGETAEADGRSRGERYRADGYVALPQFFPTAVLDAFYGRLAADLDLARNAARYAVNGPLLTKPAIEVYSHAYAPLAGFLWGLTPAVAAIAGCRLLPTYAYFRIYQQGDVCRVHGDRPACEHSLSLTLQLDDDRPWALSVERERRPGLDRVVQADFGEGAYGSVAMRAGDAVLYQGVHHRHGRLEPNPNRSSAHLFLHWVDADGAYAGEAFDQPTLQGAQR
ncbi:hypothetical protein HMF7854_09240 [Sphingomonas ginkgonis]|uniref:Fe2OG dioxygenase domain-containing protein n=1 Tax=Sphingomonas ginkgonis TaxID=2315330 RepID=A0A3R9WSW8_9SPHN|nr:hypothetical protein [Sphingomonas ginkgonis]RST30998.1 hypothetical protein HMF7854_09240 [Sphingomonas ginkgonis]